jgi:deazaflavin-dependent oxidoreductase (nitroreductase family)
MVSRFSRWMMHTANARTNAKIRRKGGRMMGMDLLILRTVGRLSGVERESPVAWFADGDDFLVVGSGGDGRDPDWCLNLMANPDKASIELHGSGPEPVTAQRLDGAARAEAWQRIAPAAPNIAKHQAKTDREYAIIRLTPGRRVTTRTAAQRETR